MTMGLAKEWQLKKCGLPDGAHMRIAFHKFVFCHHGCVFLSRCRHDNLICRIFMEGLRKLSGSVTRVGVSGTRRSLGISIAIRIHSSGSQEMPIRFFSNNLLNSQHDMAESKISSYCAGSAMIDRTRGESFFGSIFHQTHTCVSSTYFTGPRSRFLLRVVT